ncbi:stalk domain-containing protein [Fontibacillus sp. BL9]|uniref:stalk domain-containing protein n=1 Tax=Fontibacillus sp. BL9 TaxID=3389971 RepID=UPI00397E4E81
MKKMGYLLTGLALGLTLSVTSPVLAQNVKSITAKLNSTVSVRVNGDEIHLNAPPINYNNLNYLPVGEISRALGLNVSYDKKSDEILINSPIENTPTQETSSNKSEKRKENIILGKNEIISTGNYSYTINDVTISEQKDEQGFFPYSYTVHIDSKIETKADSISLWSWTVGNNDLDNQTVGGGSKITITESFIGSKEIRFEGRAFSPQEKIQYVNLIVGIKDSDEGLSHVKWKIR